MTKHSELVCLGVDWTDTSCPCLRVAVAHSPEPSRLLPLLNESLCFRIAAPGVRYCAGWFDLRGVEPQHVNCETWEQIDRGKQCDRCRYREGFLLAHQAHRGVGQLPGNLRSYLLRPHHLYVDIFADGTAKVGTVAEARLASRLAEQGAVAACYVAKAKDGIDIRRAEEAVSSEFQLRQSMSMKRKLGALMSPVNTGDLETRLYALVAAVRLFLDSMAGEYDWIEVGERSVSWSLPPAGAAAFAAAPVLKYPGDFAVGDHSLHIKGITGPIGVFSTADEVNAQLYAGSLSDLQGATLTLGEFHSKLEPVQPSLF